MIAKCVALLAVVAQINAYVCNSNYASPVVVAGVGSSRLVGSSGIVGTAGVAASSVSGVSGATTANTRTVVAKGKYPVALDNTGPIPDNRVPVTTAHVRTPVQEKPLVRLSANIPAPRTVAHSCTCYKQILRPRVHDQYITVPTVQRYIETTHTPVVENIHYEAVPVNAPENAAAISGSQLTSSALQVASASAGAQVLPVTSAVESVPVSCVQAVPVSTVQSVQAVPVSTVQSVQAVPVSTVQSVQAVPVSTVQSVQAVPISTVQSVQAVPVSSVQSVQAFPVASQSLQSIQTVPVRSVSGVTEGSQGFYY